MSAGEVDDVRLPGREATTTRAAAADRCGLMWDHDRSVLGARHAGDVRRRRRVRPGQGRRSTTTASYPATDLGKALAQVARAIRGNVGIEVVTVDQGDWDMHSGMGSADRGWMADNARGARRRDRGVLRRPRRPGRR